MYQFPNDIDDHEHISRKDNKILIKSYGLPPIFWGYLAAVLLVYTMMMIGISGPLEKLSTMPEKIDQFIYYVVMTFLIFFPIVSIGFFFYEKNLINDKEQLKITHKLFFIPFYSTKIPLAGSNFIIEHFLDSPNMARINSAQEMKGFENKGYFQLVAIDETNTSRFIIDRSSRKVDLEKMKTILNLNN